MKVLIVDRDAVKMRCTKCGLKTNLTWERWPNHCTCRHDTINTEVPLGTALIVNEEIIT